MKQLIAFLFTVTFLLVIASCGKKMSDYPGNEVTMTSNDGKIVVFKTSENLYGAAEAEGGKVIVPPEYGNLQLLGNFIVASMSKEEYEKIAREIANKAGIKESDSPSEYHEKIDKLRELEGNHEFYKSGYTASGFKRLYNCKGEMLKDWSFQPRALWTEDTGDTLIWNSERNNRPERNVYQLVSVAGTVTDIEDASFLPGAYTYIINGELYLKQKGKDPVVFYGTNLKKSGHLFITHDTNSYLHFLNIFKPTGEALSFDGWNPTRWTSGPDEKGIFVELKSGKPDDKIHYSARKQKIIYITDDGNICSTLPEGYSTVSSDITNDVELIAPNGREISKYYWN